jgi:hypothetical protein
MRGSVVRSAAKPISSLVLAHTLRDKAIQIKPVIIYLTNPVGRFRAGTKQPRLLYYFERDRRIVFVHAVDLKKRPKLDPDDVKVARRNKKIAEATEAFSEFTITH